MESIRDRARGCLAIILWGGSLLCVQADVSKVVVQTYRDKTILSKLSYLKYYTSPGIKQI